MKSILLSIRPEWVANILNGEKTIEIRKKFPKDYVGWVYCYCTKNAPYLYYDWNCDIYFTTTLYDLEHGWSRVCSGAERLRAYQDGKVLTNGHVVARFWCDKVEECPFDYSPFPYNKLNIGTCLTQEEIENYAYTKNGYQTLYGIHISKLEVFDRPRELSEFRSCHSNKIKYVEKEVRKQTFITYKLQNRNHRLTKAPQNYCYIESEK